MAILSWFSNNPIITAAFINVTAILGTNCLTNRLVFNQQNEVWVRETVYKGYNKTCINFTELIKEIGALGVVGRETKITEYFYQLMNDFDDLRVICQKKDLNQLAEIQESIKAKYSGVLIQKTELEALNEPREQLVKLMKNDSRLQKLFKKK